VYWVAAQATLFYSYLIIKIRKGVATPLGEGGVVILKKFLKRIYIFID
jgi:hypothetical protein